MIDYWLWDVVDCMRHEEEKILGMNTTYTVKHVQKGLTLFVNIMLRMKNFRRGILSACIVGALCACVAKGDGFRIEDGKIVVDSPFDLEIGSPEYAKALGDGIRSHADVRRDSDTGTMVTNWYHAGKARFAQPYFGVRNAWLSFKGEDKTLSSVHFSSSKDNKSYAGLLTFDECRKLFDEIAADMSRRLGEEIDTNDDTTEEEARESIEEFVAREKVGSSVSLSFWNARVTVTNRFGDVEYRLSAMMHENKKCWIRLCIERPRGFLRPSVSSRDDGRIPVYTNNPHAVNLSLRTTEQEKAHREADALRAMIKRVFGVDLDAPSSTNDMSAALHTLTNSPVKAEWFPLEKPFAGCTERRADMGVHMLFFPMTSFAIRHAFDGHVGEEDLKAESQKILDALESEFGDKIPEYEVEAKIAEKNDPQDAEPPAFGDLRAMLRLGRTGNFFKGGVGDISIGIKYAPPSYVKRSRKYEVAQRGAVVVEIVQSPILAQTKKRSDKSGRKGDR
jgi:hypothetical protein